MAENGEFKSLIGTLQQLYSRLVQMVIGVRRQIIPKTGAGASEQGVENLLSERLEKLAAVSEQKGESSDEDAAPEALHSAPGVGAQRSHEGRTGAAAAPDFTQHFHDRGADELVGASVGEKITSRALEHMNKALLLARKGDRANARLHADIANSAVKEAARYMSEGEYREFVNMVKERLNKFEG
jgi:hypothetical protein